MGVRAVYVNPKGTSKESSNGKQLAFINYKYVKLGSIITTRDVVVSWNLALRWLKRMRGSRVKWSPDSPVDTGMKPNSTRGTCKPLETALLRLVKKTVSTAMLTTGNTLGDYRKSRL